MKLRWKILIAYLSVSALFSLALCMAMAPHEDCMCAKCQYRRAD
jgi:hypothetical protein